MEAPLAGLATIAATLGHAPDPAKSTLRLAAPAEFTATRLPSTLVELTASGMIVHVALGLAQDLSEELGRDHHDLVISTVRPGGGLAVIAYAQHQPIIRRWWRHVLGVRPPLRPGWWYPTCMR